MLTMFIVSCSGLETKIARKWKVVSFGITPGANVSDEDRMMIEATKKMFEDVVYELDDKGEFRLIVSGRPKAKGKYELNEKESTIFFAVQGMKEKYRITGLTDSTLVLQSTIKPVEMRFSAQQD
jgi:hypothetical protein